MHNAFKTGESELMHVIENELSGDVMVTSNTIILVNRQPAQDV